MTGRRSQRSPEGAPPTHCPGQAASQEMRRKWARQAGQASRRDRADRWLGKEVLGLGLGKEECADGELYIAKAKILWCDKHEG